MSYPKPLHWWVDNVLPLVYDGSLSYYEVMSKVVEYINGLTGDMTEVKTQIENINAIIETLEPERIEGLLTEVDRLAAAVSGFEGRVGNLETDNTANKNDIANLKQDVNQLDESVGTLETNVGNFGGRLGSLEQQVSGYTERISNAENLAQSANNNTSALGERVNAAEMQINNVGDKANNIVNAIAATEDWYTATRNYRVNDLVFVGSTLYEVITPIENGTSLTIGTNIKAVTLSENNKKIKDALDAIETNLETLNTDVGNLKTETEQNTTDIGTLKTDVNSIKSELNELSILEPLSLLNMADYGEDEERTLTYRIVTKTGNSFRTRMSTPSTTYMHIRLFGGLASASSEAGIDNTITFENSIAIPAVTGCDVYAVCKYNHISGDGNPNVINFKEVDAENNVTKHAGPSITRPGVFMAKLDPAKHFNATIYSRNAVMRDEMEISLIALPTIDTAALALALENG